MGETLTSRPGLTEEVWRELGFSSAEIDAVNRFSLGPDDFQLGRLLGLWRRAVESLERRRLWVPDEHQNACDVRDDLDETVAALPAYVVARLAPWIDELDRRFRDWTVASGSWSEAEPPKNWWRGRL